jgi:transposase
MTLLQYNGKKADNPAIQEVNVMGSPYSKNSHEYRIFEDALDISPPWEIQNVRLDFKRRRLDINLGFIKGSSFTCPECGKSFTAYDSAIREWRHLDFFQFETHLYAPLPRIKCSECGVKTVEVPWARKGSAFTLLFEAWAVKLSQKMTIFGASRELRISDDRLWRLQTGKAYRLKLLLQELLDRGSTLTPSDARGQLKGWCRWALTCRIPEMREVAKMIKRHLDGILRWFQSRMTNGLLEGYNSVLRAGRGIARGFRTSANVILKSLLTAGKLDFGFPQNIWNQL